MTRTDFILTYVLRHEHMPTPELIDSLIQEGCIEPLPNEKQAESPQKASPRAAMRGDYISFTKPMQHPYRPDVIFPKGFIFQVKKRLWSKEGEEHLCLSFVYDKCFTEQENAVPTHEVSKRFVDLCFDPRDIVFHSSNDNYSRMLALAETYRRNKYGNRCPNSYKYSLLTD